MQHYGCPTRLLDWTHSPYVALYFALIDNPPHSPEHGALWALNIDWLKRESQKIEELLRKGTEDGHTIPRLIVASSTKANQRMVAQQGELIASSHYDISFTPVVLSMVLHSGAYAKQNCVLSKVRIHRSKRLSILRQLQRMNVTHASLFPGPEGFAKFLATDLELRLESQEKLIGQQRNKAVRDYDKRHRPKQPR